MKPPNMERPRTVEGLATDYLSKIRRQHPKGPYCLAGYSFGGFVALVNAAIAFAMLTAGRTRIATVACTAILIVEYDEASKTYLVDANPVATRPA